MSSKRFVVTVRRMVSYDSQGKSVYPSLEPDPIEFPNLNARQSNRLLAMALNSVDFDAEVTETSPKCPYTFAHTRHWCGNIGCRDS